MARCPVIGKVKRRIARKCGEIPAIRLYRNCLSHVLFRLAADPRWRTLLAVTPDIAVHARGWPRARSVKRIAQGPGDLGRRMHRLFRGAPPGPAVIVGSDIPAIRAEHIARAFKLLGRADAVFGPTPDGGYWLVGLRNSPRRIDPFGGVRWSSPEALADTLANLEGKFVAFAPRLSDVDTKQDYRRERKSIERLILAPTKPIQGRRE